MRSSACCCVLAIAIVAVSSNVIGQGSCTPAFTPGVSPLCGVDPAPSDCVFFDAGSGPALYVTGSITTAGSVPVARIARWDGVSWSEVAGGLAGSYGSQVAVHDDGTGPALYVVGSFTSAGGVAANNVARWNGTSWSAVGPGLPSACNTIAGGNLGGAPVLFAATPAGTIFRWTGTTWTQIATADNLVEGLAIEDIGTGTKLYVGGRFSNIAGIAASKIASFDGASWQALGSGIASPGLFSSVTTCRAFGGELFVGGYFSPAPGISENIARWNGTSWMPAGAGLPGPGADVDDLEIFDDGSGPALYACGDFSSAAAHFARWTGSGWTAVSGGAWTSPRSMATFDPPGPGGILCIAGQINTLGGPDPTWPGSVPAKNVGLWNGSTWSAIGTGFNGGIACATTWNGELLVGGNFTQVALAVTKGVARWNGSAWSGFGAGLPPGTVGTLLPSNVGGPGLFAAQASGPVSRWDGASWQTPGSGAPVWVVAMTEYPSPSGPVVVTADTYPPTHVSQWDGVAWTTPFGSPGGSTVGLGALASYSSVAGNLLFIGGTFSTFGGLTSPNLVCWNGTSLVSPPFPWPPTFRVLRMEVLDDGAGPALFLVGRPPPNPPPTPSPGASLYRWDGTSLAMIGTFDLAGLPVDIYDLGIVAESSGPVLYATGLFASIDGMTAYRVGRRTGVTWTGIPGIFPGDYAPFAVEGFSEGGGTAAYLGGPFTTLAGIPSAHLARFGCPRPALALAQTGGAGFPLVVTSSGLVAGRETFNVFSVEPCAGVPGGGPLLGLCASDPATLFAQAAMPVGTEPFHVIASQSSMTFGPYSVPPLVVDGLCVDVDAVSNFRWSAVTRLAIQ